MGHAYLFCVIARRYHELECWQLANKLKKRVYALISTEPARADRKFCDQIRDSARGGPRAISEGFGRFRPSEFARYLEFARASLMETQNHVDDALDSGYVTAAEHAESIALADRAIGATTNLHKYLRACKTDWRRQKNSRSAPRERTTRESETRERSSHRRREP